MLPIAITSFVCLSIQFSDAASFQLTDYEHMIASQLVLSCNMRTGWRDIAGLQPIIRELYETVILPIQQSKVHKSSLIKPPKGMLNTSDLRHSSCILSLLVE